MSPRVALITGASRGLGLAAATALASSGWTVVGDGRDAAALAAVPSPRFVGVPGDVTDPGHRTALAAAVREAGQLDLLVNNASELGPSPLPMLADYPLDAFRRVLEVGVVAPLAVFQAVLPLFTPDAVVVNISSDAAVEPYPGWGGYGSAKAALDQLTAVIATERAGLRCYAFDPGDMRTGMQQAAFPGEDISDRPLPSRIAVPALLRLVAERLPSGRYAAAALAEVSA